MGDSSLLYVASLGLCPRRLGRVPREKTEMGKPPEVPAGAGTVLSGLRPTGQSLSKASLAGFKSREPDLDLLGRPATSHC